MADSTMFANGPVVLDTPETMFRVLKELAGGDATQWRGGMSVWNLSAEQGWTWRMELNDDKGNQVIVQMGQALVLTYGRLLVLEADEV
ncbi:hypothetical protein TPA4_25 [Tsukamurella phage TPA4]|uniref:hypothetical protein n=1 Tax=Tsukamurella phage TPA4 TaxID=1647476 RepID=UPI0007B629BC|nr:hypothetical protein BH784_gp25 [Tsukamurella phage TPA4]AKJ72190.1 hypothetical protein TPA4_25 [Tsukamurella phage TPA4]